MARSFSWAKLSDAFNLQRLFQRTGSVAAPPSPYVDPSTYPPDHPNTGLVWYEDEESKTPWNVVGVSPPRFFELIFVEPPAPPPPPYVDPSTYPPDHPDTGFVWYEDEETETPWGDLGLPPSVFLEIVSTTDTRITQVGFASWSNFNPEARVTQVDFSSWSNFNPEARITQINVSVWRTTDDKLRRLVNVYFV